MPSHQDFPLEQQQTQEYQAVRAAFFLYLRNQGDRRRDAFLKIPPAAVGGLPVAAAVAVAVDAVVAEGGLVHVVVVAAAALVAVGVLRVAVKKEHSLFLLAAGGKHRQLAAEVVAPQRKKTKSALLSPHLDHVGTAIAAAVAKRARP
mmetsp:Transcript_16045/g.23957  ORF Transcript_16045/g.23957 Transcript_16045/m.23957 type:complete len:147 (+) Transcript_16045:423-863(+)